ncbi:hypothetical protein ONE63_006743 [Megalurothrips usitatus]|uniref:Ig-like domain-containing protein n=1 Tax=Megalurothrips usitatus TaxID=439358 RepID=A0AAV7XXF1_9NEOP|nr:hypothetical protein ONE63_006743 [Megalurothrips usitatus]
MAYSVLTFRPKAADDGASIRCHADNPHLDGSGIEDTFVLNVVHPPVVELRLGDTLNPGNIKEGDDVYFECSIRSNPAKHRIMWFHNVSTLRATGPPHTYTISIPGLLFFPWLTIGRRCGMGRGR